MRVSHRLEEADELTTNDSSGQEENRKYSFTFLNWKIEEKRNISVRFKYIYKVANPKALRHFAKQNQT